MSSTDNIKYIWRTNKRNGRFYRDKQPDLSSPRTIGNGYLFSGYAGLDTECLKKLFRQNNVLPNGTGILEPTSSQDKIPKNVRFLSVEGLALTTNFDRNTYTIKTDVMNILDTRSKQTLIRKSKLHEKLKGSKFITPTSNLFDFNYEGGVYIIRPCGIPFCFGKDITIISSLQEFIEAKEFYSKLVASYSVQKLKSVRDVNVIVSEYITSPLLFEDSKFHLRLYLLIVPLTERETLPSDKRSRANFTNAVPFKCIIARHFGKILTAAKPYVFEDFENKDIHDSHPASTPKALYFPNDFHQPNLVPHINDQLDQLEIELGKLSENIKPFRDQAKAAYEVFALDVMVLKNGDIKLLEVNDRVGYKSINNDAQSTKKFTLDISKWIWKEAIFPLLAITAHN